MMLVKNTALFLRILGCIQITHALEVQPGDFEMIPDGKSLALLYYTYTDGDKLYNNSNKISEHAKLSTNIGMARYIYAVHPVENISIEPQVILPFGGLKASNDISALGNASGVGDLVFGIPIKYAPSESDTLGIAPFVTVPSGEYNNDRSLNLGANRWNSTVQFAWTHHFNQKISLENIFDTSFYSNNNKYLGNNKLRNNTQYEYQSYIRYNPSPITAFGFGGGWITGGETKINDVSQDDRLDTVYIKFVASHFFTPNFQTNLSLGRDLITKQGVKQDFDMTLRLGFLF